MLDKVKAIEAASAQHKLNTEHNIQPPRLEINCEMSHT